MLPVQQGEHLRYKYFFETSGDLLCEMDGSGRFACVNRTFLHVLGYPEGTLIGEDFIGLVHPEDAAPVRGLFGSTENGEVLLRFKGRFLHRDGSYPSLSFVLRRLPGQDEVYGTGREVGEEPEHERRQRMQLFRMMQETARVGGWDVDCRTMDQYWTEETYRIHEVPFSFVPRVENGIAFYAPESHTTITAAFGACINEGKPYDLELQIITARGHRVWVRTAGVPVLEDGKVVRVLGAFQDIDVFKRREIELEEKLSIIEQQRSAIQALSAPIIQVWDDVLALPVVGLLDKLRAEEIMGRILEAVVRSRARYAILDLTGVDSVDEVTADQVVRILKSIQLLGAQGLVTGIRPGVAQTLTSLGSGFEGIRTLRNLREALKLCMQEREASGAARARS